jgi:hypothetical protein
MQGLSIAALLPLLLVAPGQRVPVPEPLASASRFQVDVAALAAEYEAAERKWRVQAREARKKGPEAEKAVAERHPVREYWPRFEAAASAGDGRALAWMVEGCEDLLDKRADVVARKRELVERLLREHAGAEWAAEQLVELLPRQKPWFDEAWVRETLERLATASGHREVAASAWYALAQRLTSSKATDEERERGAGLVARIEKDFAGTRAAATIADRKSAAAYDVGGTPDFEAVDTDGVAFKLSDYRGKVVLLDFWGFW